MGQLTLLLLLALPLTTHAQIVASHSRFATNAAYWYAPDDSPWTFAHTGRDAETNSLVWIEDVKACVTNAERVVLTVLRPSGGGYHEPTYTDYTNKTIARLNPGQGRIDFLFPDLPPGIRHVRLYGFSTNAISDQTVHSGWVAGLPPNGASVRRPLELQWEINDGPNGETNVYKLLGFYLSGRKLWEVQRLYFAARASTNHLTGRLSLSANSLVSLDVARLEFVEDYDFSRTNLWKTAPTTFTPAQRAVRIASAPAWTGEPWTSWKANDPVFSAPTPASTRAAMNGIWPGLNTTYGENVGTVFLAGSNPYSISPRTRYGGIFGDWRYALAFTNTAGATLTITNWLTGTVPGYSGMTYDPASTNWLYGVAKLFGSGDYDGTYLRVRGLVATDYAISNGGEKYSPFKRYHYFPGATNALHHGWCALANYLALYPSINLDWSVPEMLDNDCPYLGYAYSSQTPRRKGRQEYDGWQGGVVDYLVQALDLGWDYAATNRLLAEHLTLEWPFIRGDTNQVAIFLNRFFDGLVRDYDFTIARGNPWTLGLGMQSGPDSLRLMNAGVTGFDVTPNGGGGAKHQYASSISQQGTHYIGSLGYMMGGKMSDAYETFQLYALGGSQAPYDLSDLAVYRKIAAWADLSATLPVANGYDPGFGDASKLSYEGPTLHASHWQLDWKMLNAVNSPNRFRMARYLRDSAGRGELSDSEWSQVTNQAARAPVDIRRAEESRVLPGIGLAILETGLGSTNDRDRAAVILKTGVGYGHDHSDHLDLNYFALKARLLPDFGVRNENTLVMYPYGYVQDVHNVVSVGGWDDPRTLDSEGSNSGNWLFSTSGAAQVMAAELWPAPGLPIAGKSRMAAMVSVGTASYVAGVQRVQATTNHATWNFGTTHMGPGAGDFTCNAPLTPLPGAATPGTLSYKFRKHAFTGDYWPAANTDKGHAVLEFRWKLSSAAGNRGDIRNLDGNGGTVTCANASANMGAATNTFLTVRLFDRTNDYVVCADAFSAYYKFLTRRAYVLPEPGGPAVNTTYLELIEPHAGAPFITNSESLSPAVADSTSTAPKVLKVQGAGFTDHHFFDLPATNRTLSAAGMTFNGGYGFHRADGAGAFAQMKLVAGSGFTNGSHALSLATRSTGGLVGSVDYRSNTFTFVSWTGVRKPGWHRFYNASHQAEYYITNFTGSGAAWRDDALIGTVDVADSYGSGDFLPTDRASLPVLDYPKRRTGVTFVNETGTRTFKGNAGDTVTRTGGDAVTASDFTDEDGDGWEEARVYDFGPGDTVEVPAEATLIADGTARWRVIANATVTVTVPGSARQSLFLDGVKLDTARRAGTLTATLDAALLTGGTQLLRAGPDPALGTGVLIEIARPANAQPAGPLLSRVNPARR